MDTTEIISDLERIDGSFPGTAMAAAVEKKEEITPELLNLLEKVTSDIEPYRRNEDYFGHIYAMFLLAQFRESRAWPVIWKFFALPEEITWELTGDIITEDLGRILASISVGDPKAPGKMIADPIFPDLVRTAALDAMLILFKSGEISREELIHYFSSLYSGGLENRSSLVWNHLVVSSVNIYPEELMEEIKKAYEKGLADDDFIPFSQVDDALQSGMNRVLDWLQNNPDYTLVNDAISDVSKWLS